MKKIRDFFLGSLLAALLVVCGLGALAATSVDDTKTGISSGSGSGTVSSVAATGANGIVVGGSPITGTGTLALSLGDISPTTLSTGSVTGTVAAFTNVATSGTGTSGGLRFSGYSGVGINWDGNTGIDMYVQGQRIVALGGSGFTSSASKGFVWSSHNDQASQGSVDTALMRNAAKVVELNSGTAGVYTGTALVLGPQTVAQLPTCAAGKQGGRATVTDANATTFLSTVAGGGANIVPVMCNGTNWVIGEARPPAANDAIFDQRHFG